LVHYEALRHVTIGQYIPTGSAIHRLDPRTKLVAFSLLVLAVILATTYSNNILLLLLVLVLVQLARLPMRYILSAVTPALPIIIVLALLQLLFYGSGSPDHPGASQLLLAWGPLRISTAGLRMVVVSLLRFLDLLFLTSLLTNTTTTSALTYGTESLLRPLSAIGLPGHEIALVGAIALRFVPILGEQLEAIMLSQASRGVSLEGRGRLRFIANARRLANLIVPLFVDAYRRSEEMVLAMQARCYRGGKGRTHLVELVLVCADYAAMGLVAVILVGVIVIQYTSLP